MLSIESLRKIDSLNTTHLTNEELEVIRNSMYDLGQLIFEDWQENKKGSKSPVGSVANILDESKI